MKKFFLLLTNPKKFILSLFDDPKFYSEFMEKMPLENYRKIVGDVLLVIENHVNQNKETISESFLNSIPKDVLFNAIENAYQIRKEEREENISNILDSIKNKIEQSIKAKEEFEKRFDYDQKDIGDKIKLWDVCSLSDVETGESIADTIIKKAMESEDHIGTYNKLMKDFIESLGDCIVTQTEVNQEVMFDFKEQTQKFSQNLEIYSTSLKKKYYVDSKHINLVN